MAGQIYDKNAMILRTHVGDAEGSLGSYRTSALPNGEPMIESVKTGKYYRLGWGDIIKMAIEAGINEEDSECQN